MDSTEPRRQLERTGRPALWVIVLAPDGSTSAVRVDGAAVDIGRARTNGIAVDDKRMSSRHLRIRRRRDTGLLAITDEGSSNGTWVNGEAVSGELIVRDGLIRAGDTLLWVEPEQTWETPELDPGRSVACDTVAARLQQARELQGHVLLLGPTGTGKSYVARELAAAWGGPLVAVNCAAMPESLLESELFGHEAGAFTGAVKSRRGLFEAADGGTLFLDEIGEMSSALQAKLLTAIETGEIRPVGATATRCVQVRIIAATNTGVSGRHHGGTLREDLYHRLAGSVVEFAPLRRRVPLVAQRVAESLGVGPAHLTPEALESLLLWVWPGNYRELTNELQRLKSVSTRPLDYVHLSEPLRQVMEQRAAQEQAYQQGALPQAQLAAALEQSNGNVSAAAESLKLHRTQFRRWAKGYGLI